MDLSHHVFSDLYHKNPFGGEKPHKLWSSNLGYTLSRILDFAYLDSSSGKNMLLSRISYNDLDINLNSPSRWTKKRALDSLVEYGIISPVDEKYTFQHQSNKSHKQFVYEVNTELVFGLSLEEVLEKAHSLSEETVDYLDTIQIGAK